MKSYRSSWMTLLTSLCLLSLVLSGCNLPSDSPTPTSLPPTQPPTQTLAPTLPPTATLLPPTVTAAPKPTATVVPTETKPPIILQKMKYSGVMVYNRKTTEVEAYSFDGKPLGFKSTLPGAEWLGATQVQAFQSGIYYYANKDRQVYRRSNQGLQPLTFIPKSDVIHFLITDDEKRIAWTTEKWGANGLESEIWVADITGANAKRVLYKDPAQNKQSLVYHPLRWLSNGQIVYVEEPSGIGGYILFYGFAEIWIVDPATTKFANFSPPTGKGGLCLRALSPDTMTTISSCGGSAPSQLVMYNHTTKKATEIAALSEQGQAGSVFYSPDGKMIAYAIAKGNADAETGKLVVVPSGGSPVNIISAVDKAYINVLGWVDNERIAFIRYANAGATIFIVNKDGKNLVKIADGDFAGLIQIP